MYKKKCSVCGNEFSSLQPRTKVCGAECRRNFTNAYDRAYHAGNLKRYAGYKRKARAKNPEKINAYRRDLRFRKMVEEVLKSEG